MMKWLEDMLCKEKMSKLVSVYLGEWKTEWRHNMVFKYVKRCHKQESSRVFSITIGMKTSSNGLKLQRGGFRPKEKLSNGKDN